MLEKIKVIKAKKDKIDVSLVRIIFQMNNLDPGQAPFTEGSIIGFLNSVRDILTSAIEASFIINGATGLQSIIQKSVKRLSPSLIFEKILPLSEAELVEALEKRIANSGYDGKITFEHSLIKAIYDSTNANFRETLGLMETLSTYFDSEEPLMNNIMLNDCYNYFFLQHNQEILKIAVSKTNELNNKGKVIKALSEKPNMSVSELSQVISIKQGNTSTLLTDLENDGIVTKNKNSSTVECILSPRYYFAAIPFFNKRSQSTPI